MDFSSLLPSLISAIVSAATAGIGVYVGMSKQIAVLETKVDILIDQFKGVQDLEPRVAKLEAEVSIIKEQHNHIRNSGIE